MIDVQKIKEYVDETRLPLIRKSATGAPTLNYIQKMYGVRGKTKLNLLETTVEFGDGSECGFKDAGKSELSQREMDPAVIDVDKSFCDKKLAKYFLNAEVRMAAGESKLPAEQQFIDDTIDGVVEGVEKFIWAEDNVIGSGHYKGFLGYKEEMTQAEAGATIYASVKNAYKAIPANSIKDSVIFVDQASFRDLVMELTEKNLFHYAPVDNNEEIVLPGTNVKVVATAGLNGKNAIVSLNTKHAFYGTDMSGDEEKIDFWYSKDNKEYRLTISFSAGTQVAFPLENVYVPLA